MKPQRKYRFNNQRKRDFVVPYDSSISVDCNGKKYPSFKAVSDDYDGLSPSVVRLMARGQVFKKWSHLNITLNTQ